MICQNIKSLQVIDVDYFFKQDKYFSLAYQAFYSNPKNMKFLQLSIFIFKLFLYWNIIEDNLAMSASYTFTAYYYINRIQIVLIWIHMNKKKKLKNKEMDRKLNTLAVPRIFIKSLNIWKQLKAESN